MATTTYFTKYPSDFFRIPESRYFRSHATYDVYEFLLDMAYRADTGLYGDSDQPTKLMADQYKKGKVATFTTVSDICTYRGLSRNTVKDALTRLIDMGLVRRIDRDEEDGIYWKTEGMLYIVADRIRDKNNKLTKEDENYLCFLSRVHCGTLSGSQKVQRILIREFKPGATPLPILNLRFADVDRKEVRKVKKEINAIKKQEAKERKASFFDGVEEGYSLAAD